MKKYTKFLALLLALGMVFGLAACTSNNNNNETTNEEENKVEENATPDDAENTDEGAKDIVYMITDVGDIDDKSFNQGTYEGIQAYCEKNGYEFGYIKPISKAVNDYVDGITQAVNLGATVIITPGYLFEAAIYQAQEMYPDVSFILIDGRPNDGVENNATYNTASNTVSILYAEEQAGFLAGYAAVKEGYTSLGFMGGMEVPAVVRYGYGFVQGADYAAAELGIDVEVKYHYTGDFVASPDAQNMATSWYSSGTELIFACGGGMGASVMNAADQADAFVIGVDVDQYNESDSVITSAVKGLAASVESMLNLYFAGSFPGGQDLTIDATTKDGVGIAMENSRLVNFTQADYDAIYAELEAGNIDIIKDTNANGDSINVMDLVLSNTTVNLFS